MSEGISSDQLENARAAYQVAIEMWGQLGQEVWAKYNVMLVANSIVIAVVGLAFTSTRPLPSLIAYLPIVGIILCLLWFIMTKRSYDYQVYYLLSARELEEQYLASTVKTLSRGATFASGQTVSIDLANQAVNRRMSFWSRILSGQSASYITILLFVILYGFLILQSFS